MSVLPPREPFMSYNFKQVLGPRLNGTYAKGSFDQSATEK